MLSRICTSAPPKLLQFLTEFSHSQLEAKMDAGFARVDRKLDQLDRIERKLDRFIDVQLQTNALVERRLAER